MKEKPKIPRLKMFGYAMGDGAISITMNGISNFAMLYYTQILGLGARYAGLALSITMLWDAISDPLMGYISDHTRSRFGRRLPYSLIGGILLAFSFLSLWTVPQHIETVRATFWCVLALNLGLRTFLTVFMVPHIAMGFELCPDYVDRSRLQGIRNFINQMTNLIFGALAWVLFFKDDLADTGERIDGSAIADNYLSMGVWLSGAVLVVLFFYILNVLSLAKDNRDLPVQGRSLKGFTKNMRDIFRDRLTWFVFGLAAFALLAMMLTSQVQMFTYVFYMEFNEIEKTAVHGAGMVSSALGALFVLPWLVRLFDKKGCAYGAISISCFGGIMLAVVFTGELLTPGQMIRIVSIDLPVATIVFAILQSAWWCGASILVSLAMSMMADISEINLLRRGELKDGGYSSVLSFTNKTATSLGLLITGGLVEFAGIDPLSSTQTPEALRNIALLTFLSGPFLLILSLLAIFRYPVNKQHIDDLRKKSCCRKFETTREI